MRIGKMLKTVLAIYGGWVALTKWSDWYISTHEEEIQKKVEKGADRLFSICFGNDTKIQEEKNKNDISLKEVRTFSQMKESIDKGQKEFWAFDEKTRNFTFVLVDENRSDDFIRMMLDHFVIYKVV